MTNKEIMIEEFSKHISVYENGEKIQTTWAGNQRMAWQKADIFADYYRDLNGQRADIEDKE